MAEGVAGFGSSPFGAGNFGSGSDDASEGPVLFEVSHAVSLSKTLLKVDFTGFIDQSHAPNFDIANYTIPGLTILNVDPFGITKSIIIQTSTQLAILYTLTVKSTVGPIQGPGGEQLDPLHDTAIFEGAGQPARFTATAQSAQKVRLNFGRSMAIDAAFVDPVNYQLLGLDGTPVVIEAVEQTGPDDTRGQLLLDGDLVPFALYTLNIGPLVKTAEGESLSPDGALVQWKQVIPFPIRVALDRFSGTSSSLLGVHTGQVFFSPALHVSSPNSVLQIESVRVCTRAFDVYAMIPSPSNSAILYTYPPPSGTTSMLGALGGVLWASAHRLGLAVMNLADLQEDAIAAPVDGEDAVGLLEETIDITKASFLNDARWRVFPGTGASLGAFCMASNLSPIGAGPTSGPFSILAGPP